MAKRMFRVTLSVDIAIEESVFSTVLTDAWREHNLTARGSRPIVLLTSVDLAGHLALGMLDGRNLAQVSGFWDQPADGAVLSTIDVSSVEELRKGALHE